MLTALIAMLLSTGSGAGEPTTAAQAMQPGEDPDRIVCRRSQPVLGSRIARQRICRTVAEWRAFEADRAQMRRDLNSGNCNGDPSCSENSARQNWPRPGPQ